MNELLRNPLWFYLLAANIYLFGLMGYDKAQAKKSGWRIPERNLLFMGVIGGGIGGLAAQRIFHHKTRKKKFYLLFSIGLLVDVFLVWKLA